MFRVLLSGKFGVAMIAMPTALNRPPPPSYRLGSYVIFSTNVLVGYGDLSPSSFIRWDGVGEMHVFDDALTPD